jgi:hypothetical protein
MMQTVVIEPVRAFNGLDVLVPAMKDSLRQRASTYSSPACRTPNCALRLKAR